MKKIISLQNENIKRIVKLRKAGKRKKSDSIIIEGKKEIELALSSEMKIIEFYFCPEIAGAFDFNIGENKITEVSKAVFEKISYREAPDGYLAIARPRYLNLAEISLNKKPLILVLENVEKPGNLGALLRTALAAEIDLVIINDQQTDIYNPNVIRASRGAVFIVPVLNLSLEETKKFLKKNKIKSFAATGKAEKEYTEADFTNSSAIVLGTESKGLSKEWLASADELIKIPMKGGIDSLNVSVSGAIIIYEALRQGRQLD